MLRKLGTMGCIDEWPEHDLTVDHFPAARRSIRLACVTETYPPEVNDVLLTVARMVDGLQRGNHDVQWVRPQQAAQDAACCGDRFQEVLFRSLPVPRYPSLRMGLPSRRALMRLWALQLPDVVHVVNEGPLGWSPLAAARQLRLPLCSDAKPSAT